MNGLAEVIAEALGRLRDTGTVGAQKQLDIEELTRGGQGRHVEFKATLRVNLHTGEKDARMELACLKTIAGFLNSHGGTLVIGVFDDGDTVWLAPDGFPSDDKMNLHLVNAFENRIGAEHSMYIYPRFEDRDEMRALVVECSPANSPAFVKDGALGRFDVRTGAATIEASGSRVQDYIVCRILTPTRHIRRSRRAIR
ncbi:MAG: ATP-binding protein [Planctomycetes bacterium]|nr:ATP-binding protein [Planctomycetota bacterium]